jgi:hypothetical protein
MSIRDRNDHKASMKKRYIIIASLMNSSLAIASEPPASIISKVLPNSGLSDSKLAMNVKQAISKDRDLASINLMITVSEGAVSIQGPLNQDGQKDRIRQIARNVAGVRSVKLDTFTVQGQDPLVQAVNDRMQSTGQSEQTTNAPVAKLSRLETAYESPTPRPVLTSQTQQNLAQDDLPPLPTFVPYQAQLGGTNLETYPPRQVSKPVVEVNKPRSYPTIQPPNVPERPIGENAPPRKNLSTTTITSAEDLAFALVDIRKSDARFAGLSATIQSGRVTISGAGNREAFAELVRQLPGVSSVDYR